MDPRETEAPKWLDEILACEEENRRAFLARDLERLSALWSDALLVNSPINRVHTRQQVIDLLRAGTIAHTVLESTIETVERRDDLVIVMGSERVVNAPGSAALSRRFTNIWRSTNERWQLLVRHANIVAAA